MDARKKLIELALRPFAQAADVWPAYLADHHNVMPGPFPVTLGDLRAAREAYHSIRARAAMDEHP
jgi:hypothetical protein